MIRKFFANNTVFSLFFASMIIFSGCFGELPEKSVQSTQNIPDTETKNEFKAGILNRADVIKSASEVTIKKYPNSDEVLVDDYIFTRYNADGTAVTWDDTFIKILTEKGRRENKTISFYYSLPYSTVTIKLLEIIKPNGDVLPINIAENSKEMVNSSQMGSNIYNPKNKILKVNIPSLEIGDIVRYVTFRDNVKTRVPNTWSDMFLFEYTSPIKNMTVEIVGPKSLPLKSIAIKDEVKGTVKPFIKDGWDSVRYKWKIKDVPRIFKEPNMPALSSVVQRLLVSTVDKWSFISKWYWNLSKPHLQMITPDMRAKVRELTLHARSNRQKIEAIFYFVSQKIRYMGITTEKEAPGYEPHDVNITFKNKYGVCRDKAALLVSMLRIAGFKAYPVLIMNGPKKDKNVPNPYFNHAIVCVQEANGNYILMDPTDENTKELFPAYLCNQSYLVAKPEGETLRTSHITPASKNLMLIHTSASVNDAGIMIAETSMRFVGINDGAYRGYFARRKPIERKRFFERIIKKVLPGAKLVEYDIQPKNIQDTSQSLKVYLRYVAENTLIQGDGKVMIPSPWIGSSVGVVNFILGKTGLDKRKYPLVTDIACGIKETFSMDLKNAVGANIAMPKSKSINKDGLTWEQLIVYKNNILSGKTNFLLQDVEFSPNEYLTLKESLKKIEYNKRKTPIYFGVGISEVTKDFSGRNGNVLILNDTLECKVKDSSRWITTRTIKKKILTYAGKKNNSELKLKFNPSWEQVSVKYAKVTQKDGKVFSIGKDEINLMDQSWSGSAPRYPAGKILVLSLPGVEVGATIEYQIVRKFKDRLFFELLDYMQGFDPILNKNVKLITPKKFKISVSNLPPKGGSEFIYKDNRKGLYNWSAKDVQALKLERDLPPLWSFIPSLAVTSSNWQDYANTLNSAFKKAATAQKNVKKQIKKLITNKMSDREKVIAIRDFVAKNIKQVGPGLGSLPLSSITNADKTMIDSYGNSVDRAILTYAMLKSIDLKPEFILTSKIPMINGLDRFETFPQTSIFKTVLVKLMLGKQVIYLNDTNQYAKLGTTPSEGMISLALNSGLISKITINKELENRTDFAFTIRLSKDGKAVITRKRSFFGAAYTYWNKKYSEFSKVEKDRHFQELISSISQSAKKKDSLVTDFSKYPGTEIFSVTVNNYAISDQNYLYLKLPGSLKQVLGLHSDVRKNPYMIWNANKMTRTYLLNLPKLYAKKIPIAPISNVWKLPSNGGSIAIVNDRDFFHASKKPVLFINQDINITPALVLQDKFENLQLIAEKISNKKVQTVLMEKIKK